MKLFFFFYSIYRRDFQYACEASQKRSVDFHLVSHWLIGLQLLLCEQRNRRLTFSDKYSDIEDKWNENTVIILLYIQLQKIDCKPVALGHSIKSRLLILKHTTDPQSSFHQTVISAAFIEMNHFSCHYFSMFPSVIKCCWGPAWLANLLSPSLSLSFSLRSFSYPYNRMCCVFLMHGQSTSQLEITSTVVPYSTLSGL